MRLAIFWSEILHYHSARIRELHRLAHVRGHTIQAFALRLADPALPLAGYHGLLGGTIEVLSDDFGTAGSDSKISQRQVVAYLDRHEPDAVAIPGYSNLATLAALRWCRRHHRGAILMSDSQAGDYARSPATEWVKHSLVSCFDSALVAGSPHIVYAQALGLPAERIFIGYDAVDNDFWADRARQVRADAAQWRARLDLPEHFFLTASRLVPKKNVAGLLRAYARYTAQTQIPPWPLLIVGDGPLKPELERLTGELGLSGRVYFQGYLSADDMAPFYALASAFILASSYSEQWGLVVNEAMAAGTAVLVSRVCGSAADLVLDGETGFTFDPDDADALARLLSECAQGRFDLNRLGLAAQQRVARFHPAVFAENCLRAAEAAIRHAQAQRFDLPRQVIPDIASLLLAMKPAQPE